MYDIAIIGSGPAGLAAAINAKIRNKNIIVFGNKLLSPKVFYSKTINNYLGFIDASGEEMIKYFEKHIESLDINITQELVSKIYKNEKEFTILAANNVYSAKSIIIGSGMSIVSSITNEAKFLGKGVSYCATCDAALYKNKDVVVIAYSQEAVHEANFLSEIVGKVYFASMNKRVNTNDLNKNIKVINDKIKSIEGNEFVSEVQFLNKSIDVSGVFIIRDFVSNSSLIEGLEINNNHVNVNSKMETNIAGVYACGDCVGKPYQIMKAVGEGQVALFNACEYLLSVKEE